jgi:hypothetical protein
VYTSNRQAAKADAQKIHSAAELRVMYSPCLRCSPHHDLLSRTYLVHFPFAPSISHSAVGDGRSGWYLAVSTVGRMLLTRVPGPFVMRSPIVRISVYPASMLPPEGTDEVAALLGSPHSMFSGIA